MNRWDAVLALLALGASPLAARAQQTGKIPVVGIVLQAPTNLSYEIVRQGLRELGYVEGKTLTIEARFWGGLTVRLPELVEGLVRLKPDVIVVGTAPAIRAVMQATSSIPIVFLGVGGDPVALGLVPSLARPGGNVTGFTHMANELGGKQVQLLKETVPGISHLGVLINPSNPNMNYFGDIEVAAQKLGVKAIRVEARETTDFEPAFANVALNPRSAMFVAADALFSVHSAPIAALALRYRLPSVFSFAADAQAGGLLSYGPNLADHYRGVAPYVDKILKGAKASDLPVQRPVRFELIVNLKTAKALGIKIPQPVLIFTDRVIE